MCACMCVFVPLSLFMCISLTLSHSHSLYSPEENPLVFVMEFEVLNDTDAATNPATHLVINWRVDCSLRGDARASRFSTDITISDNWIQAIVPVSKVWSLFRFRLLFSIHTLKNTENQYPLASQEYKPSRNLRSSLQLNLLFSSVLNMVIALFASFWWTLEQTSFPCKKTVWLSSVDQLKTCPKTHLFKICFDD